MQLWKFKYIKQSHSVNPPLLSVFLSSGTCTSFNSVMGAFGTSGVNVGMGTGAGRDTVFCKDKHKPNLSARSIIDLRCSETIASHAINWCKTVWKYLFYTNLF